MGGIIVSRRSGLLLHVSGLGTDNPTVGVSVAADIPGLPELPRVRPAPGARRAGEEAGAGGDQGADENTATDETSEEIVVVGRKRPQIRFIFFPSAFIWIVIPEPPEPLPEPGPDDGGGGRPPTTDDLCEVYRLALERLSEVIFDAKQDLEPLLDELRRAPEGASEIFDQTRTYAIFYLQDRIKDAEDKRDKILADMERLGCD